jgi:trehalose/maltose hydrolase-like predicted phosphorylase
MAGTYSFQVVTGDGVTLNKVVTFNTTKDISISNFKSQLNVGKNVLELWDPHAKKWHKLEHTKDLGYFYL